MTILLIIFEFIYKKDIRKINMIKYIYMIIYPSKLSVADVPCKTVEQWIL